MQMGDKPTNTANYINGDMVYKGQNSLEKGKKLYINGDLFFEVNNAKANDIEDPRFIVGGNVYYSGDDGLASGYLASCKGNVYNLQTNTVFYHDGTSGAISTDPDAFNEDKDFHTITAAKVFNMPENMVTPLMRSRAKAVNFGIVYGIGAFSLAKDIGVTRKEAEKYIEDYLALYCGVRDFMTNSVEDAKQRGYSLTMMGRRRYLPELNDSSALVRKFGERVAMNMPVQGTAADIIKIAMVRVFERLKKENLNAKLIMQVHDELIVEAPENEAETARKILVEEMENAFEMKVKLVSEAGIGKTWYLAKD